MSLLSRLERALESLAEGSAEKVFGGRLDLVAVGQELLNTAVADSRSGPEGPQVPDRYQVLLALDDYGELVGEVERLQREYTRSLWKRLRAGGYALNSVPQVLLTPLDAMAPGRFRVAAEFSDDLPRAVLARLGPGAAGRQVSVPAVIGRDASCDLELPAPSVSRRHAEIRWDRNRFLLVDLGSKNGTLRNGAPVTVASLEHGDVIVLGHERVRFTVFDEPEGAPRTETTRL